MTDEQIETQLGCLISEMARLTDRKKALLPAFVRRQREVTVAIATGNHAQKLSANVAAALAAIPKPTVAEKEALCFLELGETAFDLAVIDEQMKMLEKQLEAIKTLTIQLASQRKAERL